MSIFIDKHELAEKKDIVNPNLLSNTDSFQDFYITGTNTPVNPIRNKLDPLGHVTSHSTSVWQQAVHFLDIDTSSAYTLSAFIWLNGNQTIKAICRSSSGNGACQNNATSIDGIKANCWQRISFTFQGFYESHVAFDFEATDGTVDFWLGSYKLEKGSIATAWCPAYSDYVTKNALINCVPHVNLLQNSAGPFFPQASSNNTVQTGQTDVNATDQWQAFTNSTVTLVKGETYTVSAATNGVFSNKHDPNNASNKCVIWIGAPANKVISGENTSANTFTWNSDTGTYPLRVNRYGKDSTVKCWNVKIEHGSQATDWTPCPLDS